MPLTTAYKGCAGGDVCTVIPRQKPTKRLQTTMIGGESNQFPVKAWSSRHSEGYRESARDEYKGRRVPVRGYALASRSNKAQIM